MATAKKAPAKKKTTAKKPVAKKAPVKKSTAKQAPAKKTTSKKKSAEYATLKLSPEKTPFLTFKVTDQTIYWLVLSVVVFLLRSEEHTSELQSR